MPFAPALLAPPDPKTQDAAFVANFVDPSAAPVPASITPGLTTDQLMSAATGLPPSPGGQLEPPNLDLTNRPRVENADGSVSTIRSLGVNIDGKETLIPTVSDDGRIMSDDEAIEQFKRSGMHLGKYDSVDASNAAAERLHKEQEAMGDMGRPLVPFTPATPVEAAKGNVTKLAELDVEQQKIADEKTRLETEQATAKAEHDRQRSIALDKLQAQQEMHRVQAASAVAEARSKAESEPYHTLLESRSIGQNVATGIGLILGGVSWNANHVNRGVQMLEMAMRENEVLQRQKHADLWQAVAAAERGEAALDQRQLRETAAFSARQGAAWDAVAGRLGAMIAANKGKGDTATAKRVMIESSEKAVAAWQNAETAAAAAAHLKELEKEAEEANRIREIRALKYKTKGGGTGGGGSSPALAELAAMAARGESAEAMLKYGGSKNVPKLLQTVKAIRDDAAKGAAADRKDLQLSDKDETRVVRFDGVPAGKTHSAKGAAKLEADDINLGEAAARMKDLAADIKTYGPKVTEPGMVARRITKFANAVIAIGVVSPLGKTNEALHLETDSIGIPGGLDPKHMMESIRQLVSTKGANLEAVEHKVHEISSKREAFRKTVPPLSPEEKKKYSGGGGTPVDKPDLTLKDGGTARWNKERGGYERVADIVL